MYQQKLTHHWVTATMSVRKEHPSLHITIEYVLISIFCLAQSQLNREHVEGRWPQPGGLRHCPWLHLCCHSEHTWWGGENPTGGDWGLAPTNAASSYLYYITACSFGNKNKCQKRQQPITQQCTTKQIKWLTGLLCNGVSSLSIFKAEGYRTLNLELSQSPWNSCFLRVLGLSQKSSYK